MSEKIRILFLSANPWTTSRILVDEEAREIFEKLQEGPRRDHFELHRHAATRTIDLQRLLLIHQPHIVHFSGHGDKKQKIILGGSPGRGKTVDRQGLVEVFALYSHHLRLVLLNACFTKAQAKSLAEVIDYSVGTVKGISDKAGVVFASAFYRALGFGKCIREAFDSAKAELGLTRMPRAQGIELFVREGLSKSDAFPRQVHYPDISTLSSKEFLAGELDLVWKRTEEWSEIETTIRETSLTNRFSKRVRSEVALYRAGKLPATLHELLTLDPGEKP